MIIVRQLLPACLIVAVSALAGLASGCTYGHGPEPGPCGDTVAPTYAAVIAPLVQTHCLECHGSTVYRTLGNGLDYSTYALFKNQSPTYLMSTLRHEAGSSAMPKGRPKLSECDIARIQAWIDAGQLNN